VRLDRLQDRLGDGITIEWKAFLLRPEPEARTLEQFRRYTESWKRPAAMEPACGFHVWTGDASPPASSVGPAVAARVARELGTDLADRYERALFQAYFVENRTVSDRRVLVDVAAGIGLDPAAFDAALTEQGQAAQAAVFAEYHEAIELGIYAVPAVVIDGRRLVQGAVDVDDYVRVIDGLRSES
jgi:predicted DsbA family dithiol-disulfide isomerase